ncbi:AgmX/PglI C-terminal domain-containing protein [Pleionea sediminis]|uniref:AgmX/PglI C-terminal domain-containing protein n=1 Tax=Pleionea sediminis TaxID=2569479 RepID=UPI001186B532|nr:AgmX/PglI C-terminal domain-containing protein [Pleionea sediminis]
MSATLQQPLALDLGLPWKPVESTEERYKKLNIIAGIILFLLFITIPWLPVFEKELEPREKEVVRTKVVLQKKAIPQPKPEVVKPKPKPKPVPAKKLEQPKPQAEKAKPKLGNSTQKPANKSKAVSAKASVQKSQGLDKVSSELSALRGALNIAGMKNKTITSKKAGVVATVDNKVFGENKAAQRSTGISVSEKVMKGEATALSNHQTVVVEGIIEEGVSNGSSKYSEYRSGQRDVESIRMVIERYKGPINSLYYKAERERPGLAGQYVFKIVIQPDGTVTEAKVVNSDLNYEKLDEQILARIKSLNFGKKDVSATAVTYRFNFSPA